MRRLTTLCGIAVLALTTPWGAGAEVAQVGASGFLVRHEARVAAPPERVWTALVERVGEWWSPDHTFSGDAGNLSIEARPGGCFCERLPGGGGVEHLRVVYVAPGERLRMAGALGPLQGSGLAGSATWELAAADDGAATTLAFTYSAGGFLEAGFEPVAPIVDRVLGEQFARLVAFAETGRPTRGDEVPAASQVP